MRPYALKLPMIKDDGRDRVSDKMSLEEEF